MTALHVITRLSLGGSAQNTIDSVVALDRAGWRTILAAGSVGAEISLVDRARSRGCRTVLLPALTRAVSPTRDLLALWQLFRLIRTERVALVHTHTSKAGFVGRLAAWLARVPVIVHTPHGHIFYGYYGPTLTAFFVGLERLAARLTDRMVVLTERGIEEHLARGIGRREQFRVIPSGVDLEAVRRGALPYETARARLGVDSETRLIVGLGRLEPVKGFQSLVRALPLILSVVPSARLLLVGEGSLRPALVAEAHALGVGDRFEIAGARLDPAAFLAAADLVVVPSLNEGMGRVLVEAMALGRPVVATRVGGIPAVVADRQTGTLVPSDDPPALAGAVSELLKEPGLRQRMGEAGRQRAEQFSLAVMESRLLDLYRGCCAEKGLPWPAAS
ncbi:MAG: glycosyltransferase family 4 protein [Candidatus Rokubacteria bacterium]|nr:glycosyltransferase family 4 protein [Candidatus Rokubacteria bacterium]